MCPSRKWKRRFSHHFTNQIYFVLQVVGKYFLITPRHVRGVNKKEKSQTRCFSKNLATINDGRIDGFFNEIFTHVSFNGSLTTIRLLLCRLLFQRRSEWRYLLFRSKQLRAMFERYCPQLLVTTTIVGRGNFQH